uniref:Uncharacterized protein n=1 Tax=Arundo donax TaxID=35708 RepID=A0A0A9AJG9_ARUDO
MLWRGPWAWAIRVHSARQPAVWQGKKRYMPSLGPADQGSWRQHACMD